MKKQTSQNKQTSKQKTLKQQQQNPTTIKKGKDEEMKPTVWSCLSSECEHTLSTMLERIPRQQGNNSLKAMSKNPPALNIQNTNKMQQCH